MFRRIVREYLSLTRSERHGIQVLGLILFLLVLMRSFLPWMIRSAEPDFSREEEEFIAFLDSLHALESGATPGSVKTAVAAYRREGKGRFSGSGTDGNPRWDPGNRKERSSFSNPPELPESQAAPRQKPGPGRVHNRIFELNSADSLQLLSVYGIGPVFASRILRYRELLGGFHSQQQLEEVYGIRPPQLEELGRRTFIDSTRLRKMDLNCLGTGELARHPYLDWYQAGALVAYRERMQSFKDPVQIRENHLLPDSVFQRIRPYLEAGR